MSRKLTPFEIELGQRVDEALFYVWDPIGVSDAPSARDEYSGYALRATGMLLQSADTQALADFLLEVESVAMGLTPDTARALRVADLLLVWKAAVRERHDRPEAVCQSLSSAVNGGS